MILFPGDAGACGHFRMLAPARLLAGELDITVLDQLPLLVDQDTAKVLRVDLDADVVVFHRPMASLTARAIPLLQSKGTRVVIDLDDDVAMLRDLPRLNPRNNPHFNASWLGKAIRAADQVTVSSAALQRRYPRAVRLDNYVSAGLLDAPRRDNGRTVGWGAIMSHHRGDGEELRGALAEIECDVLIVGEADERILGRKVEQTGLVDLDRYHRELERVTVGIAPLRDTAFNRARSWLKPLQYAALGIPAVVSPLPEYQRLPTPLFADRPRRWRRHLAELLADPARRQELAAAGRAYVREHLTLESNVWRYAEAWIG